MENLLGADSVCVHLNADSYKVTKDIEKEFNIKFICRYIHTQSMMPLLCSVEKTSVMCHVTLTDLSMSYLSVHSCLFLCDYFVE